MDRSRFGARWGVCMYEARTCTACGGARGAVVVTVAGGVRRESWRPCPPCGGAGVR